MELHGLEWRVAMSTDEQRLTVNTRKDRSMRNFVHENSLLIFFRLLFIFAHMKIPSPNSHSWSLCSVFRFSDRAGKKASMTSFWREKYCLAIRFYARSSGLYSYHKNKTSRIVFCCLHQSAELALLLEWIQGSHKSLSKIIVNVITRIMSNHHKNCPSTSLTKDRGLPGKFTLTIKSFAREKIERFSQKALFIYKQKKSSSSVEKKRISNRRRKNRVGKLSIDIQGAHRCGCERENE